ERLDFNIPEAVPQLKLNEDAFKQVMINIIENARQSVSAAADGGKILVEIDPKKGGAHTVSIRVTDNGCGMSVETLDRIFEPFYSTRATGSGLGMAITKQLVTQMNGTISVVSQTGKGTTVTVNFPIG
ncbi:MAG: HAMP domain-containing histidine kinase, partial [Calditrichaeota bacterium]|nr:HAMP domain-containing histidine kinase [Calditrichota bacterium]